LTTWQLPSTLSLNAHKKIIPHQPKREKRHLKTTSKHSIYTLNKGAIVFSLTNMLVEQQKKLDAITNLFSNAENLSKVLGTSKKNAQKLVDTVHGKKPQA
jgi:hypothetical protein